MKLDAKKLHGAVMGAGFMGETHAKGYQKLENIELHAIIDPAEDRGKRLADSLDVNWYESIEKAAAHHPLDFIDICVPTPFHIETVDAAFRHGCHVLVEKPVTANIQDLMKMRDLVASSDRRFMVAHVCRFMPQYMYAKEVIESGRLGKPISLSTKRYLDLPDWSLNNWINDRNKSGGTIVDLSIHDIDIANWLLGKPEHVFGAEVTKVPKGPSHVHETIKYESNCVAHVEASHLMPKGYALNAEYQLVLDQGFLRSVTDESGTKLWEFSDGNWKEIDLLPLVTWQDPYTEEIHHFTSSLRSGEAFRISFDDAADAVLTAVSLEQSASEDSGMDVLTLA